MKMIWKLQKSSQIPGYKAHQLGGTSMWIHGETEAPTGLSTGPPDGQWSSSIKIYS